MERDWQGLLTNMADFFVSGVAAALVNSSLKYLTNSITTRFRERCRPSTCTTPTCRIERITRRRCCDLGIWTTPINAWWTIYISFVPL